MKHKRNSMFYAVYFAINRGLPTTTRTLWGSLFACLSRRVSANEISPLPDVSATGKIHCGASTIPWACCVYDWRIHTVHFQTDSSPVPVRPSHSSHWSLFGSRSAPGTDKPVRYHSRDALLYSAQGMTQGGQPFRRGQRWYRERHAGQHQRAAQCRRFWRMALVVVDL